ncbi:hypothetical protein LWI29_003043 [Acer saccharum]|uniref:Protein NRT1/ PTR FAMILY 5.5-like n=1 Tax=Acer saccharum TaxID=4024 RepID=A0AA39S6R0_ACESA|nr:hypothetical protein LWI29_003043 [Acer saccharum]
MWADVLAMYAMWMMMTYLTNVWKLGFTHAAAIVNFFWGIVLMLPVVIQFLVDTIIGNYWMLVVSSFAYSVGFGFLTMSTPPVLSEAMGTCSEYKPECIGEGQEILFYTALALIAFGLSGHLTSLGGFMEEQMIEAEADISMGGFCMFFWSMFGVILVPIIAAIALPYIKPWTLRFGIPAICTVVATLIFLTGSCSYNHVQPQGSPLTTVFRVFVASTSKLFYRRPRDPSELYERRDPNLYLQPHTRGLRCLDKAAILLPEQSLEQQQANRWRLCRVTEVEGTKSLLRMIPICMTFIVMGVVSSIGLSYFIEQANHLNQKVGRLTVQLPILLWLYDIAKSKFAGVYVKFTNLLNSLGCRKYAPVIGIAISMILAILCCITAAKVEARRLGIVRNHNLIDKPEDKIPMSMFWLLPQFLLLGGFEGISETSISSFLIDQFPPLMCRYMVHIAIGLFGVGTMGGVLFVYVVGKVSERGGRSPSWFQHTLNKSRLDNYYWTLAALAAVNLVVFVLMAIWYAYRDGELEELEAPEFGETGESFDDNSNCCC